jgi:hypothetical protein
MTVESVVENISLYYFIILLKSEILPPAPKGKQAEWKLGSGV